MPATIDVAGWAPIFEKDGNRFVFLDRSMVCHSSAVAKDKGQASIDTLGPLLGIVFTGDVYMIPEKDFKYAESWLELKLAAVSGPLWDRTFRNTIMKRN